MDDHQPLWRVTKKSLAKVISVFLRSKLMYRNNFFSIACIFQFASWEKSFSYTVFIKPLTAGSETQQMLLILMPDDFTRLLGAS